MYCSKCYVCINNACFSSCQTLPGGRQQNLMERLHNTWIKLQVAANVVVDSDTDKLNTDKLSGIKQVSVL